MAKHQIINLIVCRFLFFLIFDLKYYNHERIWYRTFPDNCRNGILDVVVPTRIYRSVLDYIGCFRTNASEAYPRR